MITTIITIIIKVEDVVLIQDFNLIRSQWKLGKVSKTFEGQDGNVRKIQVQYKNSKPGEPVKKYRGRGYVTIERPANKLVVLLPNDKHRFVIVIGPSGVQFKEYSRETDLKLRARLLPELYGTMSNY